MAVALGLGSVASAVAALGIGPNSSAAANWGVVLGAQAWAGPGAAYAITMGYLASANASAIVLNAQGSELSSGSTSGFFVAPVRGDAASTPVLTYLTL
jgi:hypothetical protein